MIRVLALLLFIILLASSGGKACAAEIRFSSYENREGGSFTVRINGADVRVSMETIKSGKPVPDTDYALVRFNFRERLNQKSGDSADVSELEIIHRKTGRKVTLILGKTVEI